jgi:macrolide transport system ATP-binding/permease protein
MNLAVSIARPGSADACASPAGPAVPALQTKGLTRSYGHGDASVAALRGVDLTVAAGEFVVIIGRSGSGKSTLLSLLGLLDAPTSGACLFAGRDTAAMESDERAMLRNAAIGFVFQRFHLLPRYTAYENVELPLIYAGVESAERTRRVAEALARVGLTERAGHWPNQLSGGEQQRIAIARAIVNRPAVLLADEPTGALDTATGREIMNIFRDLNAAGQTVVMVTHDTDLARHGHRRIVMHDGRIVDDAPTGRGGKRAPAAAVHGPSSARPGARARLAEALSFAWRVLRGNPVRSVLTTLGVVVGIAAIIAMVAIGDGARSRVTDQIRSLGASLLLVLPGSSSRDGVHQGFGSVIGLTEADAAAIAAEIDGIRIAAPTVTGKAQAINGNRNWTTLVGGVVPEYLAARDWRLARGAGLSAGDVRSAEKVALLGATVAERLFGQADPLGRIMRIGQTPFRVKGVLAAKGQNAASGRDQDNVILVPLTTAKRRLFGRTGLDRQSVDFIVAKAEDDAMAGMSARIARLLRKRHELRPGVENDFVIRDPAAALAARAESLQSLTLLLLAIAGISLVVGGIGIMNIMLVSAAERRGEIALRMSVGATRHDIRNQFLIEAAALCLVGSLAGIVLGVVVTVVVAGVSGWPVLIRPSTVLFAVAAASATGLFFGFYPAHKAARMTDIHTALG